MKQVVNEGLGRYRGGVVSGIHTPPLALAFSVMVRDIGCRAIEAMTFGTSITVLLMLNQVSYRVCITSAPTSAAGRGVVSVVITYRWPLSS